MTETVLTVDARQVPLWDLDGIQLLKDDQGSRRRQIEIKGDTAAVVEKLVAVEEFLRPYEEVHGWDRVKRRAILWLTSEKPMGSSSYMRTEL